MPSRPVPRLGPPAQSREASVSTSGERNLAKARATQVSKALSQLLRHTAPRYSVVVAADGYADLANVMDCFAIRSLFTTEDEIREVVRTNDKGRFQMQEHDRGLRIRACQGHTIATVRVEQVAQAISSDNLPPVIVHGTGAHLSESIRSKGLLAGGLSNTRNDVHFAPGLPGGTGGRSGMRSDCTLYVYLDGQQALQRSLPMFLSANNVIVSPGFSGVIPSVMLWATD